jgi:hypothetical protein
MTLSPEKFQEIVRALDSPEAARDGRAEVRNLLEGASDVYLMASRDPASIRTPEWTAVLKEAAGRIEAAALSIGRRFAEAMEGLLQTTWYSDEWNRVCRMRTGFAALRELFGPAVTAAVDSAMNTEDVDEMIREKGNYEGQGASSAPRGVPPAHWWWWLPDAPPSA